MGQNKIKIGKSITNIVLIILVVVGIIGIVLIYGAYNLSLEIKQISVSTLPNKLEYHLGEEADYTGLKLKVELNNGESYIVDSSDCSFYGFDSSKTNNSQVIIVTYQDLQCEFEVKIRNKTEFSPVLVNVSLIKLPDKLTYKIGDLIDVTGGVLLCEYHNGEQKEVPLEKRYVYGFNNKTPGEYLLTIKYEEDDVIIETTYTIKVEE